jgi:hypothetical protein
MTTSTVRAAFWVTFDMAALIVIRGRGGIITLEVGRDFGCRLPGGRSCVASAWGRELDRVDTMRQEAPEVTRRYRMTARLPGNRHQGFRGASSGSRSPLLMYRYMRWQRCQPYRAGDLSPAVS